MGPVFRSVPDRFAAEFSAHWTSARRSALHRSYPVVTPADLTLTCVSFHAAARCSFQVLHDVSLDCIDTAKWIELLFSK